ncbi:MAG: FAD binding domain-containing protein [Planctomycetota bacterium]
MRDALHLYLNGRPLRVTGDDAWLMVSTFLRRRRSLPGTKVVCAEGDCGSCTALVGRVEDGRLVYRSMLSCIQRVAQLDATHVVTVEGLLEGDRLNAFQEAMVREHGAQCGFCTPGIVSAVQGLMESGDPLDATAVRRGLTGNLCRCTGYDAIVRAAVATDLGLHRRLDELYPPEPIVEALSSAASESVTVRSGGRTFFKPATLDEALGFLAAAVRDEGKPPMILGGGTDLGVVHNKGEEMPASAMFIGGLDELRGLREEASGDRGVLVVGGATTLKAFQSALAERLPEVAEFLEWFGSPPIRHAGTVAGNLCTASPIGDTLPLMQVLDAEVQVASARGRRTIPMADFLTGYRATALEVDEMVVAVRVPLLGPHEHLRLYKVSRRKDLDISSVSGAFAFRHRDGVVDRVRVAYGGVAATVSRMGEVEAVLEGHRPTLDRFAAAATLAAESITPLTDVRGSADYRRTLCRNLLMKLGHEIDGGRFNGNGRVDSPDAPLNGSLELVVTGQTNGRDGGAA